MAAPGTAEDAPPKKKKLLPLLAGLVLALVLGAGGFFVMYSGMLAGHSPTGDGAPDSHGAGVSPVDDVAFIPIEPLIISLGPAAANRHLRFSAQLEVSGPQKANVSLLMPRVLDVLNGYLRAVDMADLEERAALIRLRAQMLRRVQVVTGEGRVRDLLITEFVLN